MCGIAGAIDLENQRPIDSRMLHHMSDAITHRGPDEEGHFISGSVGLAARRLSIVDLEDGHQPVFNENRSIVAVYNGELFDHRELRKDLQKRGHTFQSQCDSEVIVHLWEQYGEQMFEHLKGQFAFALYDSRQQILLLVRDRVGICPLHWTRQDNRVYFGSEIKAILASGAVSAAVDPRGIDQIFSMFAIPGRRTPFNGISSVAPGHYLKIQLNNSGSTGTIAEHQYWDLDFPDHGDEWRPDRPEELIDGFQELFYRAVDRRLRADVPVVGYLSGGIDSATVLKTAAIRSGTAPQAFSIKIDSPFFDESAAARHNADAIGCPQTLITCSPQELRDNYAHLIWSTENPVVDTSSSALDILAREVNRRGYKVVLTGEGADEALGGYPWFKVNKLFSLFDKGSFQPSQIFRYIAARIAAPGKTFTDIKQIQKAFGGIIAQAGIYGLMSANRNRFYSDSFHDQIDKDGNAFEDLKLNVQKMKSWHPLNQSLYIGYKTILPGLLLNHKSDRVTMANSVEARYPFLDEDLIQYCTRLPVEWKLKRITQDKQVLRQMAARMLPDQVARRPKKMFRAPCGDHFFHDDCTLTAQLLSEESLTKTGYFLPSTVRSVMLDKKNRWRLPGRQSFEAMGLVAVFSTQLWHHIFLGGGLCDLPYYSTPQQSTKGSERTKGHPSHSLTSTPFHLNKKSAISKLKTNL